MNEAHLWACHVLGGGNSQPLKKVAPVALLLVGLAGSGPPVTGFQPHGGNFGS